MTNRSRHKVGCIHKVHWSIKWKKIKDWPNWSTKRYFFQCLSKMQITDIIVLVLIPNFNMFFYQQWCDFVIRNAKIGKVHYVEVYTFLSYAAKPLNLAKWKTQPRFNKQSLVKKWNMLGSHLKIHTLITTTFPFIALKEYFSVPLNVNLCNLKTHIHIRMVRWPISYL